MVLSRSSSWRRGRRCFEPSACWCAALSSIAVVIAEAVGNVGGKDVRLGEVGVEFVQLGSERFDVLGGQGDVAALQWLAAC